MSHKSGHAIIERNASSSLREKQSLFVFLVSLLIEEAYDRGFELTFGEAWRSDEQAEINAIGPTLRDRVARAIEIFAPRLAIKIGNNGNTSGIRNSLHQERLAIDLHLFKNGAYLTGTEAHRELGEWWERLHPLCRWGGRFNDGNHYSLEHEGRK